MGKEKEDDREASEKGTHVSMACQNPNEWAGFFLLF